MNKILLWTYSEAILLSKPDDRPSSFSCCVCSIKDLKQQQSASNAAQTHLFIEQLLIIGGLKNWWRTYCDLSSFNAQVLPNIIKCWRSALTVKGEIFTQLFSFNRSLQQAVLLISESSVGLKTLQTVGLPLFMVDRPCITQTDVQREELTVWFLIPLHCLDGKTQRTCRSSDTPSGTGQH